MSPILTGVIASGISGNLTPPWSPQGGYDALASVVTSGSTTQIITINSIPSGYKHLQVRATMNCTEVNNMYLRLGDGSGPDSGANYSWHQSFSTGSSAVANGASSGTFSYIGYNFNTAYPNSSIIDIIDYSSNSKHKTFFTLAGTEANGTGYVQIWGGNWRSLNPVSSLSLTAGSGYFNAGTKLDVYGVR